MRRTELCGRRWFSLAWYGDTNWGFITLGPRRYAIDVWHLRLRIEILRELFGP